MQITAKSTGGGNAHLDDGVISERQEWREELRVGETLGERDPHLQLGHRRDGEESREQRRNCVLPVLAKNPELKHAHDRRTRMKRIEHMLDERVVADAR